LVFAGSFCMTRRPPCSEFFSKTGNFTFHCRFPLTPSAAASFYFPHCSPGEGDPAFFFILPDLPPFPTGRVLPAVPPPPPSPFPTRGGVSFFFPPQSFLAARQISPGLRRLLPRQLKIPAAGCVMRPGPLLLLFRRMVFWQPLFPPSLFAFGFFRSHGKIVLPFFPRRTPPLFEDLVRSRLFVRFGLLFSPGSLFGPTPKLK